MLTDRTMNDEIGQIPRLESETLLKQVWKSNGNGKLGQIYGQY